mmetsp:Transcript_47050/g.84878  ORF Transcript_47050/g.84878 Transcript_47050/m.84878 type:complete len:124 (+) Transcript_47050:3-374(+)
MDDAAMEPKEVEMLAKKLRLKLYRTCVKDDLNVSEVFQHLGSEFVRSGGEAALGKSSMMSMEEVASKPMVDRSNAKSAGGGGTPSDKPAGSTNDQAFKLGAGGKPSVQRTGGKKNKYGPCSIL